MKVDWIWFDAVVRFMAGKVGRAQSCWPAPASHVMLEFGFEHLKRSGDGHRGGRRTDVWAGMSVAVQWQCKNVW